MTFGSTRSALPVAAVLAVSASLLLAPATAQAATQVAGTPQLKSLGVTGQVRDMVVAGGKVWVSSGNQVDVFSTAGTRLKTVTGLLGAADLIAAGNGTSVYVAVSSKAPTATSKTIIID